MFIAIEGLDAAGKNTQANMLRERFEKKGLSSTIFSFPQYGKTLFSQKVASYLNGDFGDVYSVNPYLSSLLFAGDRFESYEQLKIAADNTDVVILDRYVTSNLAYQAAKLGSNDRMDFITWLSHVEYQIYKLPHAQLTIYLDVPVKTTSKLTYRRAKKDYAKQQADIHERNLGYLLSCIEVYNTLIDLKIGGDWRKIKCVDDEENLLPAEQISELIWAHAGTL